MHGVKAAARPPRPKRGSRLPYYIITSRRAGAQRLRPYWELAYFGQVVAALPFGGELAEEALHGFVLGGIGG